MGQSLQWQVFDRIVQDLKTRVTFTGFGRCRGISPESIVGRYMGYGEQADEIEFSKNLPGIIVSPPKRVMVLREFNTKDTIQYPFLIQICDRDYNRYSRDRMRSWMKWQEQIRQYFSEGNLRGLAGVNRVTIDQRWMNRKLFKLMRNHVSAHVVVVECWESRD